jgi:hypothetical protein
MRILILRKPYPSTEKYSGLSASWIEVAGISQGNNVFMGFSLRLNQLVTNKKAKQL